MTEPKFTPATWIYEGNTQDGDFCIYQEGTCDEVLDIHTGTVRMRNLPLILAAPDLYEALVEMEAFGTRQGWEHVAINKARQALAKARGEL